MAAITRAEVLKRVPALSAVPDGDEWTTAIARADLECAADAWGTLHDDGRCYLVAHILALGHLELGGRPVQSLSVGGVSKSYAVAAGSPLEYLGETYAGRTFAHLRRVALGPSVFVG
jgi:hypothetical protein